MTDKRISPGFGARCPSAAGSGVGRALLAGLTIAVLGGSPARPQHGRWRWVSSADVYWHVVGRIPFDRRGEYQPARVS